MSRDRDSSRGRRMEPMGFGGSRVYVGDIGNRIGRHDLQREFEQYGQVLDVWMTPHSESRLPMSEKKFAFVVFRYAEDADIAVRDRNGRNVFGRKVRVEHARPPKSQRERFQDYQRRGGYSSYGRGGRGGYNNYNNRGSYYNMSSHQPPPRPNRHRSRSFSPGSRDRSYRRSPPPSNAPRNRRPMYEENQYPDRNRTNSFNDYSPDGRIKRPLSYSPEPRPRKLPMKKSSPSLTPSPPPKQRQPDSGRYASRSPSPHQKKMKKKKKKIKQEQERFAVLLFFSRASSTRATKTTTTTIPTATVSTTTATTVL